MAYFYFVDIWVRVSRVRVGIGLFLLPRPGSPGGLGNKTVVCGL